MANRYYDNSQEEQRLQPGTMARADEVDGKFDQVTTGMEMVESDVNRSIKLPDEGDNKLLDITPYKRRGRVVGFDEDGNLTAHTGFRWRGDWSGGVEYFYNDIVREPVSRNLYVTSRRHTAGQTFEPNNFQLAVSVEEIQQLRDESQQFASDAFSSEQAAKAARDVAKHESLEATYQAGQAEQSAGNATNSYTASQSIYQSVADKQAELNAVLSLGIGATYVNDAGELIMTYNEPVQSVTLNADGYLTVTYS